MVECNRALEAAQEEWNTQQTKAVANVSTRNTTHFIVVNNVVVSESYGEMAQHLQRLSTTPSNKYGVLGTIYADVD